MNNYAGDVTPDQAWAMLEEEPDAAIVDVRSEAEWAFVGIPDLSSLGKKPLLISWMQYPGMVRNDRFESDLDAQGLLKDKPILFLCRSGQRSRSAAIAMTALGYSACYNVASGFEGDPDAARQRGNLNGWKASQLPWIQQ
jgi:rhodanese-related sulfurtransferase